MHLALTGPSVMRKRHESVMNSAMNVSVGRGPICKVGNLLNWIYDRMSVKLSTVLPAAVAPTLLLATAGAVASRAVARC
jgi:hypothetical protein